MNIKDLRYECPREGEKCGKRAMFGLVSPWISLLEGDTAQPLRFPFQQKARSFLLVQKAFDKYKTA